MTKPFFFNVLCKMQTLTVYFFLNLLAETYNLVLLDSLEVQIGQVAARNVYTHVSSLHITKKRMYTYSG